MKEDDRMQEPREEWRMAEIDGLDGLEVSSLGRVRSFRRSPSGVILKPWAGCKDYVYVSTGAPGRRSVHLKVHRLVGEAFLGPLPTGLQTRHLDGDKTNNAVTNLKYGTASENSDDVRRHGGNHQVNVSVCPRGHAYDERNTYITPKGWRGCRACRNEAAKRWKQRHAETDPLPTRSQRVVDTSPGRA